VEISIAQFVKMYLWANNANDETKESN